MSPANESRRTAGSDPPGGVVAGESTLLWAGVLVAFSPILLDIGRHVAATPPLVYAIAVFPALFVRCALRDRARPARDGIVWIVAGLVLELVALFLGAARLGRPGVALAATGVCRRYGHAGWRCLVLLWLAIPLPTALVRLANPEVPVALLHGSVAILRAMGWHVEVQGGTAFVGDGQLTLTALDNGTTLAVLLAGIAWYDGVLHRVPLRRALAAAALWPVAALPIQGLATVLALAVAGAGAPELARQLLTHGPWIAIGVIGVAFAELRRRRGSVLVRHAG